MKFLLLISILFTGLTYGSAPAQQIKLDEKKQVDGVQMASGKADDVRIYEGKKIKKYQTPISELEKIVLDFSSRCNQEFVKKRVHFERSYQCKHFNKNMIETVVHKDIKQVGEKEKNEVDRFVMTRYIYNRGYFHHNELAKVYKWKNEKGQEVVRIIHRMMSNDEAKKYLKDPVEKESAFIETTGEFILTQVSKEETQLEYIYRSKTDHWLLNKSMVVGEFFENMSKGVNGLFSSIDKDVVALNTK